jgi:hypothetical protein
MLGRQCEWNQKEVTELRGRIIRERAHALIGTAHPISATT